MSLSSGCLFQLMINMLDERDKLTENLRDSQEQISEIQQKLAETERERDSLMRQLQSNLPQVSCEIIRFGDDSLIRRVHLVCQRFV